MNYQTGLVRVVHFLISSLVEAGMIWVEVMLKKMKGMRSLVALQFGC
jgi:hypothetical protein